MNNIIPPRIEHYTADEIAETLPVDAPTYTRLWEISAATSTPTPRGGDGTNGTVETPGDRIGNFGDQGQALWDQLNADEREDILTSMDHLPKYGARISSDGNHYDLEYPE